MSFLLKYRLKYHKHLLLFTFLCIILVVDKVILLTHFHFKFVSNDELIYWLGARDYMNGIFHEPFFYGQNYNLMLDSLVAIPFTKMNFEYYQALPISTSILGLFPYVFFALILNKNKHYLASLFFLVVPIALPIEYGMLCSMSRGFVSGIFFSGFLIIPLLSPTKRSSIILFSSIVSISILFNPNSIVFIFPICLFILYKNFNKPSFYILAALPSIPLFSINYLLKEFYVTHPDHLVHFLPSIEYDFELLISSFSSWDKFFEFMTPFYWKGNWMIIPVIFLIGIFLSFKEKSKGFILILSVLFLLLLPGVNKVNDGINSLFLSISRMFIGVPLLLCLALFFISPYIKGTVSKILKVCIPILGVVFVIVKFSTIDTTIEYHTRNMNPGPVAVQQIDSLKMDCESIAEVAIQQKADLVLFIPNWYYNVPSMEFYNYGCGLLVNNFPISVTNLADRRAWRYKEEKEVIRNTILIVGHYSDSIEEYRIKGVECSQINEQPNMILVENNNLSIEELGKILNYEYKRHLW